LIKVFFLLFFLFISLSARENPFFPSPGEQELPYTSNEDRTKMPLKRATIAIPSQARIIKRVTVEFKNLDGSMQSKSIELDNSVDWHLPIFISQSYSQNQKKIENVNTQKVNFKKLASTKVASFYSFGKTLKIMTDDKLIRNFILVSPHRIVADFEKDTNLKYMSKVNKHNAFSKIRVGNHKGYYRVVIELDGFYKYKMQKVSEGYLFTLI